MNDREQLSAPVKQRSNVSDGCLWFGVLGGAIAWLLHLLLAYAIAEFGCVSSLHERQFLGLSSVAWLQAGASLFTLVIAIASNASARRNDEAFVGPLKARQVQLDEPRAFMARSGLLASRLFIVIIAVQSIPFMFYLRDC